MKNRLAVDFCGVKFKNPVICGSCDIPRYKDGLKRLLDTGVGGIVTKSVTDEKSLSVKNLARFDIRDMNLKPIRGSVPDKYYFFSRGGAMVPMDDFLVDANEYLKLAKDKETVLIGSISAGSVENWVKYAKIMEDMGFPMLELNFGNPHGAAAAGTLGIYIGQSVDLSCEIVSKIKEAVDIPFIVKLTPQVDNLVTIAEAVKKAGASAVNIMHRYQALIIDPFSNEPVLDGLAAIGGPWMKPVSLSNVSKVYSALPDFNISGGNGADNSRDVLDFILAGANVVQIATSVMVRGTEMLPVILQDLKEYMKENGIENISQLRGSTAEKIGSYKHLGDHPDRRAYFNLDICDKCVDKPCISRCYFAAIKEKENRLVFDEDRCTGCSMCLHICPYDGVVVK